MTALLILVYLVAWILAPLILVALLKGVPAIHRLRACSSLAAASARCLVMLPVVVASPLAVAIALLQTKYEENALPRWARWWDNDVSINGDQAEGAETYYAPGADRRSFRARFVWLVLRNRASWLAQYLGHVYQPGEQDDREVWGDPSTGRDREGWTLNRCAGKYQLYLVQRIGSRFCLRINCGHKIWSGYDQRPVAMVVYIPISVLTWKGSA